MSETEDSSTDTITEPAAKPAGRGVAWLALLLSALALAAVGFTLYQDWRAKQEVDLSSGNVEASISNLGARIATINDALLAAETRLDALAQNGAGTAGELDALQLAQADVNERLRLLNSLPIRIGNAEAALAAMQGVTDGARDTWLLGEAEYYMQLANAQLQLAGNPELAALALGMADDRIAQLANPALTNVRIAIADEVAALEGMQIPDVAGITLKLVSLTHVVESLPLRSVERIADDVSDTSDAEMGRLDRAWQSVKSATSGIIKHRTTDEEVMPLISPDAEYFLRTNLTLQMQTARLALLRGEQQVYEASLSDAEQWLRRYFDAGNSQVGAALASIEELQGGMFAAESPDISGSLRLLRRHTAVSENAQ